MTATIHTGHVLDVLASLSDGVARCCVTSPPYWGLRDYQTEGQAWPEVTFSPMPGLPPMTIPAMVCSLGNEVDPWAFIGHMVEVFRGVRRVLSEDGALWLNLGDSYASNPASGGPGQQEGGAHQRTPRGEYKRPDGLKPKDLIGIPWRAAFALQADGWYLRSDVIWSKPNPMPESVTDRPTKAHEYVFLLSKGPRYFFDQEAVKEAVSLCSDFGKARPSSPMPSGFGDGTNDQRIHARLGNGSVGSSNGRNLRSVWQIATVPFSGAHFATFPPELPERCIKAGSAVGDTVLDPFNGAGTTGLVAGQLGRDYIGIELNSDYADMARQRLGLSPADDRREVVKAKAVEGLPLFGGVT